MGEAFIVRRNAITSGGSGGSGPSDTDAILTVTAPTGSTVTATKGNITLTPTMWVQAADPTFDCALFVISPSLFDSQNAWTVTATNSEGSISQNITVNEAKQYDVTLFFGNLYWHGDEYIGITGGWELAEAYYSNGYSYREPSFIKDPDLNLIRMSKGSPNNTEGCIGTVNKVDLTRYNSLNIDITYIYIGTYSSSNRPRIIVSSSNVGQVKASAAATRQLTATGASSLDISSLSGKYYILFCCGYYYNEGCGMRFDKVWLET